MICSIRWLRKTFILLLVGEVAVSGFRFIKTTFTSPGNLLSCVLTTMDDHSLDAPGPKQHRSLPGIVRNESKMMNVSRRFWIQRTLPAALALVSVVASLPKSAYAHSSRTLATADDASWTSIRAPIQASLDTLVTLTQNWERAVIDCTYADVPRDLLATENKALLLEKASVNALFDKSAAVISCKTVVTTVRDYLGRTGIGPLAHLNQDLRVAFDTVLDADVMNLEDLDALRQSMEDVQEYLARADGLSYAARKEATAVNNFDPSLAQQVLADPNSQLTQCRRVIESAIASLQRILQLLPLQ